MHSFTYSLHIFIFLIYKNQQMKTNIKKTKERNNLPIYIVFGLLFSFFLGLVNSPNKYKYVPQSIIPSIEPVQTKIETVFIEKVIEPIKVKVDTTESIIPENDALEGVTIIDEDSYGKRSYVYDIRNMDKSALRKHLKTNGFRNLENATLVQMRRMWMAFHYESMLMNLHLLTEFPISMLYSFFIIEATTNGIETNLWRLHANAGGLKAFKGYGSVTYKTYEVIRGKNVTMRAKFMSAKNTQEGIEAWAKVLNSGRYDECKKANYKLPKKQLYESICKCVYESGYHTDPKYKFRAQFMAEFWKFKTKNLPIIIEEF
jgi:hypothetical protein